MVQPTKVSVTARADAGAGPCNRYVHLCPVYTSLLRILESEPLSISSQEGSLSEDEGEGMHRMMTMTTD
ncbi:unnamed protein product [Fusarium graminearum]|nr:unnamed protein product [Fusarium graminearum]CAG2001668.1 unnamed protein product [Fusarium graminearum]VTO93612.1 unnamed protein product [Fusarium graminearum]